MLDIAAAIATAKYGAKVKQINAAIAAATGNHKSVADLTLQRNQLTKPPIFHQLYHYVLTNTKYWGTAGAMLSTTDFGPLLAAMVGGRRKSRRRHRRRRRVSRRP